MRLISMLLLTLIALTCRAESDISMVKKVNGSPNVLHDGQSLAAKPGMKLYVADKIVTGAAESVGVIFNDGTTISAGPSTELDLREYIFDPANSKFAFSMFLKKGTMSYESGKLGKLAPAAVKLDTPRSSVGVRGTKLLLDYQ